MGKNKHRQASTPESKKQAAVWCAIAIIAITVMGAFILHVVGWTFDELKKVQKKLEKPKDTLKSDPPEA